MVEVLTDFKEIQSFYQTHYAAANYLLPQELKPGVNYLGMRQNGKLVAVVETEQVYNQHLCFIWKMVVDKSLRHQGVGTKFYQAVEAWVENTGSKKLIGYVYTTNLPSVFFFLNNGFIMEGLMSDNDEFGSKVYTLGKSLYKVQIKA